MRLHREHPMVRFCACGLLLPALSAALRSVSPQALYENPVLFAAARFHSRGGTNLVLYAFLSGRWLFERTGLKRILTVCTLTALLSSRIAFLAFNLGGAG